MLIVNFTQFFPAVWVVTSIERLKTVFTVLMLNNVQCATIFGMTTLDAYAKPLLQYWPRTTYVNIYGKNLTVCGAGCTPDIRPAVMTSTA